MSTNEQQTDALREILRCETRLLDELIHHLAAEEGNLQRRDPEVVRITVLMIQSLGVSLHSIVRLTEARDMAIRDAYGIGRSASELAVNICYIAASGSEVAKRADRHALQKSFRDLHRSGSIGGAAFELRAGQQPDPKLVPGLAEALAEFTGRRGQEIPGWTPLSISSRIEVVGMVHERAALSLSGSTMAIYRHASELLHGTYFSVVYFWSAGLSPPVTPENFDERWAAHFLSVFTAAFFAAQAVVELYSLLFDLPNLAISQNRLMLAVKEQVEEPSGGTGNNARP